MGISTSFGAALGSLGKKLGVADFMAGLREGVGAKPSTDHVMQSVMTAISGLIPMVQAWLPTKADNSIATLRFECDRQGRLTIVDVEDRYACLPKEMREHIRRALQTYDDVVEQEGPPETFAEPMSMEDALRHYRATTGKPAAAEQAQ